MSYKIYTLNDKRYARTGVYRPPRAGEVYYSETCDKALEATEDYPNLPKEIMKELEVEHKNDFVELVKFNEKLAKTPELMFEEITKEMADLYKRKNADYGNSFSKIYGEFGLQSTAIRLQDKVNRLKIFSNPNYKMKVSDESIRDTLMDIANYSIMTIMELEKHGRCSEDKTDDF